MLLHRWATLVVEVLMAAEVYLQPVAVVVAVVVIVAKGDEEVWLWHRLWLGRQIHRRHPNCQFVLAVALLGPLASAKCP